MNPTIGLVYDLRSEYLAQGYCEDDVAEFDSDDTINQIEKTIENLGYNVDRIGNGKSLCARLAAGNRWDMVFNIAEGLGGRCRESYVPSLLEMYNIPYTFSDPMVCAMTLDKSIAKQLISANGLATAKFMVVEKIEDAENIALDYPLFAKPIAEGTGKGIDNCSKIQTLEELRQVCQKLLLKYNQPVIVEEYLPGREFTVGILGTAQNSRVIGTMEIKLVNTDEPAIYSYVNKEECESRIKYLPLNDDAELKNRVEQLALKSYNALQCRDAGRVDIRCDKDGNPCFMEVNPLAGLHPTHSDLPMIATQEGMAYETLIKGIIDGVFSRVQHSSGGVCLVS